MFEPGCSSSTSESFAVLPPQGGRPSTLYPDSMQKASPLLLQDVEVCKVTIFLNVASFAISGVLRDYVFRSAWSCTELALVPEILNLAGEL